MESPKNLSHKPIISVNDYDQIDGCYANNTDAKALSIGNAQYDETQISLKIWRMIDQKWSRQSEELPIHRNLDLSILFLSALFTNTQSILSKPNEKWNIDEPSRVYEIKKYYEDNKHYLEPRLRELKQLLNELI